MEIQAVLETPVTVFFDGQCPLCSREIDHYRGQIKNAAVSFVDIAAAEFDAALYGIDLPLARQVLHVKVGDEMHTGIDAVIAMWQAVPTYRWLARLTRLPGAYFVAGIGYRLFASFRPYLQRRIQQKCDTGVCRQH